MAGCFESDKGKISCGGIVVTVGKTVGVHKIGGSAAQLFGAGVHGGHKVGYSTADMLCDYIAGLVGR